MPRNSPAIFLMIALSIVFFAAGHTSQADDTSRKAEANLTEGHAKHRRAQIAGTVTYNLKLKLEQTDKTYAGTVTIKTKLVENDKPLTVDFTDGKVTKVSVNNALLSEEEIKDAYNGYFIKLPTKHLKVGDNVFTISYEHEYSKTGNGFYRMADPADGRVYTYTNFEPYHANHLLPIFDQPDVKGRFTLQIDAPEKWVVVSALRETKVSKAKDGRKTWTFPETKPISTYILPLHAGEYHIWEDKKRKDVPPMRLFARQSMAQYVKPEEWFTVTEQGFKFFNEFFGYAYPFEKYDQLIVPDFNWGAMENVGAVTFTERYAPRSKPTREQRMNRANTILHELAHMWFGNLVTMAWWDDLWLNESFATYMANLALAEATEFKEAWDVFYKGTKQWAYWEDGLVTKHPITTEVPNTEQAFANFDGITYGKGASTLKQIAFFIGIEKFKKGVQQYFRTHAFGNTVLNDFMGALAKSAEMDLDQFTAEWLRTSGTNRAKPIITCKDGKVSSFAIEQSPPEGESDLRSHRTKVALYQSKGSSLTTSKVVSVKYAGKRTNVPDLVNESCPKFVNLNFEDHDFVKLTLDKTSLETAKTSLSRFARKLDRMMIWASLWDMVETSNLDIYTYDSLARNHFNAEQDDQILVQILRSVRGSNGKHGILHYLPGKSKAAVAKKNEAIAYWEKAIYERLKSAPKKADSKKILFDSYVSIVRSKDGQNRLYRWVAEKRNDLGIPIGQDRRWAIIARLSELDHSKAKTIIAAEEKRDNSSQGKNHATTARVLIPDLDSKKTYFKQVSSGKMDAKLAEKRAIINGLFPVTQANLHRKFADEYFNKLPRLAKKEDATFVEEFAQNLAPAFCTQSSNENLRKFVSYNSALPPYALRVMKISLQMDERCFSVRETARASITGAE